MNKFSHVTASVDFETAREACSPKFQCNPRSNPASRAASNHLHRSQAFQVAGGERDETSHVRTSLGATTFRVAEPNNRFTGRWNQIGGFRLVRMVLD